MNAKGIRTLEYDKVIGLLKEHVQSEVGQEMADRLQPSGTLEGTRRLLDQTLAAEHFYRTRGRSPIGSFPDIRNLLARLPAAHSVSAEDLLRVARLLNISREARTLLQEGTEESVLSGMAASLSSHRSIEEEIGRCILSPEEIADAASPELARIRKQIRIVNERIKEKLNSILRSNALSKYLQDPIVTVRNGRYAVPVKAEHRAQIPGLIHDQSASGATVFIEPAAVVEMGISGFGEMRTLSRMAKPTLGVFTVIGHAHLEFLHDLNGVLAAKTEMLENMAPDAWIVVNGDDALLRGIAGLFGGFLRHHCIAVFGRTPVERLLHGVELG